MKLSICIATYNGSRYVQEQVESIMPQLEAGDEIVAADDGSTDGTVELLLSTGPQLRLVATARIGGVVSNFERVLAAATGDGIVLCDQDDVWLPGRLALIRNALRQAALVVLNGDVVDAGLAPTGRSIFETVGVRRGFWNNWLRNGFVGCCMAFRCDLLARILPFPSGVPWHDWYIGLVATLTGEVAYVDTPTLLYRRHGANHSLTGERSTNSLPSKAALRLAVLRCVLVAMCRSRDARSAAGPKDLDDV